MDVFILADKLDGYTGSDIVAIIQSAKRAGCRRAVEGGPRILTAVYLCSEEASFMTGTDLLIDGAGARSNTYSRSS